MAPGAPPRDLGAQRRHGQLPAEVTGFIGRKAELARVTALLEAGRLVTVFGPGGVGKTRLALRAAALVQDRYPDGTCLIELSGTDDPGMLAATVADRLAIPAGGRPDPDVVIDYLRHQRMLLILDTCEHLIDACADLAEAAILGAPGVTLLATSRQPLDVLGEHTFLVPPLPVPALVPGDGASAAGGDALELFGQRAAAAVPGFQVTPANRPDAIRLCQRLDGIPLAIELAAVRLRALPLPELTARLDNRFQVLTSGRRGAVPRHQTLRSATDWSYRLCSPAERELWARLSAFAGGFDAGAAHEACADPGTSRADTLATLAALVDKSVVLRETADGDRYRLLDTLREYGRELLAASGREAAIRDRLLARALRQARAFEAACLADDQLARFRALHAEDANLQAALGHALGGPPGAERERAGADLAIALAPYWLISGLLAEGSQWLDRVLDRFAQASPQRARALAIRGRLATFRGDIPAAVADIEASIPLAGELGDELLAARAPMYLSLALAFAGRHEEAAAAGARAQRLMAAADDQDGLACGYPQLALLAQLTGDLDRCLALCGRGLRLLGDRGGERWVHSYLHLVAAFAYFRQPGRTAECLAELREALQAEQELGDLTGLAYALEILGWMAARERRLERAAWLLGAADGLWRQSGRRLDGIALLAEQHDAAVQAARDALGDKRYAALAATGRRRPLAYVIGHALAGTDELRKAETGAGPGAGAAVGGTLTAREQEIAVLVASGLSNREIAGRLFISKRTVDAHVEHIFSKLDISSRVQLTVWLRDKLAAVPAAAVPATAVPATAVPAARG
ncbi:MAG TPA: LuxR C-terminal-related transcriptional regulator [Trebonia sp.]|jgi:non-specific serine/threonine protein kinase|nr:LuxR C-terminal-related transcriptional regulator [Trebonia sp.]